MVKDLSYIHDLPSEALEAAITQAVEEQCLRAIINYLEEVATTMDTQGIETLNVATLRAMAITLQTRSAQ